MSDQSENSHQYSTLYDKIWHQHIIGPHATGGNIVYIDQHFIHEVTSPQAFDMLSQRNLPVFSPKSTLAIPDHNVPTTARHLPIEDDLSRLQITTLKSNAQDNKITHFDLEDIRNGIVHVVGPEQGVTQPGMTIVCGDSHTSTHGAFGALAFGIGTSEVAHTLATQTLVLHKSKNMRITVNGTLPSHITAKDLALTIIGKIGTDGGTGHVIEYTGDAISALSMEGRMTLCNLSIEAGARAGMIAPDEKTFSYLKGRPMAPKDTHWAAAVDYWSSLKTDEEAVFDKEALLEAEDITPMVTWGTSPEQVIPITGTIPNPEDISDQTRKNSIIKSLKYMGLKGGQKISGTQFDRIFIGSCTNSRIEDLRAAADVLKGRQISPTIKQALAVPGSGLVKQQAEKEGLDKIFKDAGFEWREPGCSMCLGMNPDRIEPQERCASTSNRNFEGRQGPGGRTHLLSPAMAAAAAIAGHLIDARDLG